VSESKGIMSRFSRLFGGGKDASNAPAAPAIGLFGKHPAWGDFVHEDPIVNMKSGILSRCRVALDTAIRRNIDEGRWRGLAPNQKLPWQYGGDGHTLLWKFGNDWLVGRMWPSRDSVDRAEWPAAVLTQVSAAIFQPEVSARAQAFLDDLKSQIIAAAKQTDVLAALRHGAAALPALLADAPAPELPLPPEQIADLLSTPQLGAEGPARILYFMDTNFDDFRAGGGKSRSASSGRADQLPGRQLRIPTPPGPGLPFALTWMRFLLAAIEPRTSILALIPDHQNWLDLAIGEPTSAALFGLKANLAGEPLTTQIPFELPPGFAAKVSAFIGDCRAGQVPAFPAAA